MNADFADAAASPLTTRENLAVMNRGEGSKDALPFPAGIGFGVAVDPDLVPRHDRQIFRNKGERA